jgi:hypothetical protein
VTPTSAITIRRTRRDDAPAWGMIFFGKPLHTFPDHASG